LSAAQRGTSEPRTGEGFRPDEEDADACGARALKGGWPRLQLLGHDDLTKIVRGLPKGTPVANKTGEVDFVRNDVAIVNPYGDAPYVLTVLTKGLTNYSDGLSAIRRIARTVHAAIGRG